MSMNGLEQNIMYQFLVRNEGKKYSVTEIAQGVGTHISVALYESYERLRRELDYMVDHEIIESTFEGGDIRYYFNM